MPTRWTLTLPADARLGVLATPDRLHGLACRAFESEDVDHTGGDKPFAVRPLRRQDAPVPGWALVLSWQRHGTPPVPAQVRLGPVTVPVVATTTETATFAAIAGGDPAERVTLAVRSSATFSRNGSDYPLPDPAVMYMSLARRFTAAGWPVGDEVRDLARAVRLYRHDIHTEPVSWHGQRTAGFVGSVTVGLSGHAPDGAARLFGALSRFAEYAGVGRGTTHGFGAVDVLDLRARRPPGDSASTGTPGGVKPRTCP
jgi:CRISPR-associated endoribonuclease Cas6